MRLHLILGAVAMAVAQVVSTPATAGSTNRALLVGVSRYSKLAPRWQLQGPLNDVRLFQHLLLRGRLGRFEGANVRVLAGWPTRPADRPTRANIQREFERLAIDAQSGDEIVILMAGHGSQQPAAPGDPEEPDGLDETFLPADVGGWDGSAGRVRNAITDNEIHGWLAEIRAKGAFVWILFDSCHSGTMSRGGDERAREVPARELVPAGVLGEVARRPSPAVASTMHVQQDKLGGLAAIYAAQPFEITPEKILPAGSNTWHGLFTYHVAEILEQATDRLTYAELAERVNERYRSLGRFGPTPAFEGGDGQRAVLGANQLRDRPAFVLGERRRDAAWALQAGAIHGLTRGSVLAVWPPAGVNSERPLGYVRISALQSTKAVVVPTEFQGTPPPPADRLQLGSRCQLVELGVDAAMLRIGAKEPSPPALAAALDALKTTSKGLAASALDARHADWTVTTIRDAYWLEKTSEPSAESAPSELSNRLLICALSSSPADLSARLASVASKIARVTRLRQLSGLPDNSRPGEMRLEVSMLRLRDRDDHEGTPVGYGPNGRVLNTGDLIEFRVRNVGSTPADVTALFISSDFEIRSIFPAPERQLDVRVEPGADIVIARTEVTDDTVGSEDLAVIGLPSTIPPVNLGVLAQAGVTTGLRGVGNLRGHGLAALLADALAGTRGPQELAVANDYCVRLLSWRTIQRAKSGLRHDELSARRTGERHKPTAQTLK